MHRKSTPYWPQANGEVERQNRSLLKRIRTSVAEGRDWKDDLMNYLYMYISTQHSVTGVSPAEMLYGRKLRTKLPEIEQFNVDDISVRDQDNENIMKGKDYSDRKRNASENSVEKGDLVLLRNQKENKFSTPFMSTPVKVIDKFGSKVTVRTGEGVDYNRNVTFVKKYIQPENDDRSDHPPVENTTEFEQNPNEEKSFDSVRPCRGRKVPEKFKDFVMT